MKLVAWVLALLALTILAAATTTGNAAAVALPCAIVGALAWLCLAVTDHLENR